MNRKRKEKGVDGALYEAVELVANKGVDLSTVLVEGELLKQLTKRLVEKALESEMEDHLGYRKHERTDADNPNRPLLILILVLVRSYLFCSS